MYRGGKGREEKALFLPSSEPLVAGGGGRAARGGGGVGEKRPEGVGGSSS